MLPDFADLAERAGPAVVNIRTTARVAANAGALPFPDIDENDPMYEFFRRFFPESAAAGAAPGPAARVRAATFRAASGRASSSRPTAT